MSRYQLIQKFKSKTEKPSQYQLLHDSQVLVESCTYSEGIKYVQELIKPGDTFQEKEIDISFTPEQSYDAFVQSRELDMLFDKGMLQ